MAQVSSLMLARFTRLPRRSGDTWQGGVVRMPMWVDGPDGTPYRPWGGVWVSLETGGGDATLALDALLELGFKFARTGPAAIQVADQALGEQIARAIGDPELAVTVDPHLAAVKAMVQRMASETSGAPSPAALDRKGMTVERMRAFAAAARAFHDAAPWRFLSDEDLIHVEAPSVGAAFRHVTVLGGAPGRPSGWGSSPLLRISTSCMPPPTLKLFSRTGGAGPSSSASPGRRRSPTSTCGKSRAFP